MSEGQPVGVVLTGGASRRMGVDKASLVVDGKPMVVTVADALWEAGCDPVECQGGDNAAIGGYGLDVFTDPEVGGGPVPAILEALTRHAGHDVVVVACDLAGLDGTTVRRLVAAGRSNTADVAVAAHGGQRHLAAIWRSTAAGPLAELIADGVDAYRAVLDGLDVVEVDVPAAAVRNVNSPADLEEA